MPDSHHHHHHHRRLPTVVISIHKRAGLNVLGGHEWVAVIRVERRVNSDYAHSQRVRSNTPPLSFSLSLSLSLCLSLSLSLSRSLSLAAFMNMYQHMAMLENTSDDRWGVVFWRAGCWYLILGQNKKRSTFLTSEGKLCYTVGEKQVYRKW